MKLECYTSQEKKNHQWPTVTGYKLGKIRTHYANRGHSYSGEEEKTVPKFFKILSGRILLYGDFNLKMILELQPSSYV